jgi:ubiquinone biosynthesis protein UbiJ
MPDMAGYKTPLPGILAAMLETAINRILALDDLSRERLRRLDGRMLRLDLEGIGIALYFAFTHRHVEVGTRSNYEPDTIISGSPFALFTMAAPEEAKRWGTPESRVNITGDANLARDLERLFSRLDPDWEGRLSRLLGDVWGHQVAAGLRTGAAQLKESATQAGDMFSEYVQRNQGPVARAEEIEEFSQAVAEVGDAAEQLAARIVKLTEDKA